ncbi:MAG: hypothetical protein INH41_21260 [Myxococcaceae bacterium]|nr:hypothetical protein [Myxococcaceae bacterium]MCA3014923.1 hypothetical protein [Myxococcaceae bacterium]
MRLPLLFRRENSSAARRERQAQLERAVTQGLRRLSHVLERAADLIEKQRLARSGYETKQAYLQRLDKPKG